MKTSIVTIYLLQNFRLMKVTLTNWKRQVGINSQIWRLQRKKRVTASRLHEVDKKWKLCIETD